MEKGVEFAFRLPSQQEKFQDFAFSPFRVLGTLGTDLVLHRHVKPWLG